MGKERRNRLDLMSPVEKAINNAMSELEKIGADPRLTSATNHLQNAKDIVSDWLDEQEDQQTQDSQPQNPPPPKP